MEIGPVPGRRLESEVAALPTGAELLPPGLRALNLYAIHGTGRSRRYLAMTPVPGPAPDFHRLQAFTAIELPE